VAVPPKEHNPYGAPHLEHVTPPWYDRNEKLRKAILEWADTKQLSVFGRNGYYVTNYLFASLPLQDRDLIVWVRLPLEDAQDMAKDERVSVHPHHIKGWMTMRVDEDKDVEPALKWIKKAYEAAIKVVSEKPGEVPGAPIYKVPESPGKPDHKIPQGPRSGKFVTGLDSPGAFPQKAK
jgi:hypothetical protein